jgi:two-component system, NtrC family, sensor histidine kinase PilS
VSDARNALNPDAAPVAAISLEQERARAEDWRALAVLGPYRLLLVVVLLTLFRTGYGPDFFLLLRPATFYYGCLAYALAALVMLLMGVYRRPGLSIQAHMHLATDTVAIAALVLGSGGIASGLGILLLPPVIGSSLVVRPRLAAVHAAAATLAMFAAEFLYQWFDRAWDINDYSQVGLLGLMFFASGLVANVVAQRARRSEAVAARVGSEFLNLSRLSENIIESMHTGVLVIDATDHVRVANAAARRLAGEAMVPGAALQTVDAAIAAALRSWRDGRTDPLAPLHAAATGREITARFTRLGWGAQAPTLLMLEDAAELRRRAQQIKLAALGRLSAGIAHEIRNPLSAIAQAGQLLAESGEISGENQRLLAMIQRHTGRIDRIVRDVLDLSRRDRGHQVPIDLREWLLRTAALYHESHPHDPRPIELLDVGPRLRVRFDPEHLQQILFNLWDNSFEHGARAGFAVTVTLQAGRSPDGDGVQLDVSDNGPGIAAALHDRVFEPFFTTHSAGTGLGLFLCRELCEYNQAQLSHVAGRSGATFRIRFTMQAESVAAAEAPQRAL